MNSTSEGRDSKLASWTGIGTLIIILAVPLAGYLAHENSQVEVTSAEVAELRVEMSSNRTQMQGMSNQLSAISQKLSDIADAIRGRK